MRKHDHQKVHVSTGLILSSTRTDLKASEIIIFSNVAYFVSDQGKIKILRQFSFYCSPFTVDSN